MIPSFDRRGNLPPGIHEANWKELEGRFNGSPRRTELLAGLREALVALVAEPKSRSLFLDFFQRDRDGKWKGIVQIDLEDLT